MSKLQMGETATFNGGRRDAFHAPSILVSCKSELKSAQYVRFTNSDLLEVELCDKSEAHGIVDPWIGDARPGLYVWVLVKPELVGDLVHHFGIHIKDAKQTPKVDLDSWDYAPSWDNDDRDECSSMGC